MKGYVYLRRREQPRRSPTAVVALRRLWWPKTTMVERFLLLVTIGVLPLQSDLPKVRGISMGFILFALVAGYMLLWRPQIFVRSLRHPVFLAGFALVGVGLVMEFLHDSTGFFKIRRILLMLFGAVVLAALCRDRQAIRASIYGLLGGSVILASLLFLKTYGAISAAEVHTPLDAERLRYEAFIQHDEFEADLNQIAFFTALGAMLALVLALTATSLLRRYVFSAIAIFCVVATFLPLSRGGLVNLAVSCAAIAYARGITRPRVIIMALILVIGVLVWVPQAAFSRFTISTESSVSQHGDGRVRVYRAIIKYFPEYALTGVGISHLYGEWGRRTEFAKDSGYVIGAHNCLAQVTIYWGLAGLLALLMLIWRAYRCLPKHCGVDPLCLCLLGTSVSILTESMLVHTLEGKEFSLALGLLASAALWRWPYHRTQYTFHERRLSMQKPGVS